MKKLCKQIFHLFFVFGWEKSYDFVFVIRPRFVFLSRPAQLSTFLISRHSGCASVTRLTTHCKWWLFIKVALGDWKWRFTTIGNWLLGGQVPVTDVKLNKFFFLHFEHVFDRTYQIWFVRLRVCYHSSKKLPTKKSRKNTFCVCLEKRCGCTVNAEINKKRWAHEKRYEKVVQH